MALRNCFRYSVDDALEAKEVNGVKKVNEVKKVKEKTSKFELMQMGQQEKIS